MFCEAISSVMAEFSSEGRTVVASEMISGDNALEKTPLAVSGSLKEGVKKSSSRRRVAVRPNLDAKDFINFLHDKERELGEAQSQIKALKLSERLREKAVEKELNNIGSQMRWPLLVSEKSSHRSGRQEGMEFFKKDKAVRLQSHPGK